MGGLSPKEGSICYIEHVKGCHLQAVILCSDKHFTVLHKNGGTEKLENLMLVAVLKEDKAELTYND